MIKRLFAIGLYQFSKGVAEVNNFKLQMRTNFDAIDFPEDAISPASKTRVDGGGQLTWEFRRLVSGVNIAMAMPERLQPGPLASQISAFAPVSLFLFIVQLVYLVLFSYAFFFKGLTGLAITIGAIATLFVLMQVTARVDCKALFAPKAQTLPVPETEAV